MVHELAHASHYVQVKNDYWDHYIKYVLQSFVLEGWTAFGSGLKEGAGYCEVGEMWGFFMQESLYAQRYGGSVGLLGNTYWFQPDILTYLYRHGLSHNQIFRAFTADVTSVEDLKDELINRYPAQEALILQAFRQYDK